MIGPTTEEAQFTGLVKRIYTIDGFHGKPPKTYIEIECQSEKLGQSQTKKFSYTKPWIKLELKVGNRVEFLATIKITTLVVHKETRQIDTWHSLPYELTDYEDIIEVCSPKQIKRI